MAFCPSPRGTPLLLPLTPENFGVVDLRHYSAVHNFASGGLLDGLHREAAVQGITKAVTEDQTPVINSPTEKGDKENGGEKSPPTPVLLS